MSEEFTIPKKEWFHLRDIFSRVDEELELIAKILMSIDSTLKGYPPPTIPSPDVLTQKLEELLSYIRPVDDYFFTSDSVTSTASKTYEMDTLLGRYPTSGYITNDGTADITFKINDREKIVLKSGEVKTFGEAKRLIRVKKLVVETTSTSPQDFRIWLW
jgi:hypothetical protein